MKTRIARALNISSQAVCQWERVPADRVLAVARIMEVPPHELRPDLYPDPVPTTVARGEDQQP